MKIDGRAWRTIWREGDVVCVIDQTRLPFALETVALASLDDAARAIRTMIVRGAPLIGATAAHGVALAMAHDARDDALDAAVATLLASRPTAVNLRWALERMAGVVRDAPISSRVDVARREAEAICEEDVAACAAIGMAGAPLIRAAATMGKARVNILTHCNAGWLATVDHGTALAPIYRAHDEGVPVHVWVDETRPRNQGASLTAYELGAHGVPHTVIADNAGGHLMQKGAVDLCIVGADRIAANGDAANKIGTYLKALAARDTATPFYVAAPSSTIDWRCMDGVRDIPIEERNGDEVTHVHGADDDGVVRRVRVAAPGSDVANPAFDVTPARLIDGVITERGVARASREGLRALFPQVET